MLSNLDDVKNCATSGPATLTEPKAPPAPPADIAPLPPISLAPAPVGLNDSLPRGIGTLYVSDHGSDDKISIRAFFEAVETYGPREHLAPRIYIEDAKDASKFYELMSEFSLGLDELKKWLLQMVEHHPVCLVIHDHSQRPIPWEMFRLATTENRFLGGEITTVRWTYAQDDDAKKIEQVFEPDECQGEVVAYVDPGEANNIGANFKFLDDLRPVSFQTPFQLRDSLYEERAGCGLVFVFCHGYAGTSIYSLSIGPENGDRLPLANLRTKKLHRLKLSRAVVFLNACNSGRQVSDTEYLCDSYRRSFCELFLGKGARGVIATLDKVEAKKASEFARLLWESMSKYPDRPLACHLRDLRAAALATVKENDDPTAEQFRDWLHRHLYVYYGNPNTVLRLTPGGCHNG